MATNKSNGSVLISNEELLKRRKLFDRLKIYIRYIGALLVIFFTWLQIKEIPTPEINERFSQTVLKITLSLCYLSWILGTVTDLDDEEYTFVIAPNNGKLTTTAIGIILTSGILFGILCLTIVSLKLFCIALTFFSVMGKTGESYTGRFVKSAIEKSKINYIQANDQFGLLSIIAIEKYILGKWLWTRFYIGSAIILLIDILAFSDLPIRLSVWLSIQSPSFITVSLILIYIVIMEAWIWIKRIQRKVYLSLLSDLKDVYVLIQR